MAKTDYKPHPCCLKTLLDYSIVASWCCEEIKVFLQNLVDTFRANLEELGEGWLTSRIYCSVFLSPLATVPVA